jgi:hypothetical protein
MAVSSKVAVPPKESETALTDIGRRRSSVTVDASVPQEESMRIGSNTNTNATPPAVSAMEFTWIVVNPVIIAVPPRLSTAELSRIGAVAIRVADPPDESQTELTTIDIVNLC